MLLRTLSFDGRPSSTSGAAYLNVPAKAVDDEKKSARDRPMSETFAWPSSVSRMFDGFTSLQSLAHQSCQYLGQEVHCRKMAVASDRRWADSAPGGRSYIHAFEHE